MSIQSSIGAEYAYREVKSKFEKLFSSIEEEKFKDFIKWLDERIESSSLGFD